MEHAYGLYACSGGVEQAWGGRRWPVLACVGRRWPSLAIVGRRWPLLACVDLC